jgi:hypothetical protein
MNDPIYLDLVEDTEAEEKPILEDLLECGTQEFNYHVLHSYLDKKWVGSTGLTDNEIILLQALASGRIGTGAQRGSITRILNTLKQNFPEPEHRLMAILRRAAETL